MGEKGEITSNSYLSLFSTPKVAGKEGGKEQENNNAETSPPETLQNQKSDSIETGLMESSVYEDIRKKLIVKGVPSEEIAFIHHANTDMQKAELFAKVRSGQVRILLGSTQKMGAGTNVRVTRSQLKRLRSSQTLSRIKLENR